VPSEVGITYRDYIQTYMKIQTKNGELIPLKMNSGQRRFYELFAQAYDEDKPFKIIILKARQIGFSTITEAVLTALTMTNYYRRALIVAHDSEATSNIFNMTKRYYDNLPMGLKPMVKYSNARELRFENPDPKADMNNKGLQSGVRVATAGQGGIGRSQTINYMHLSELAFWPEQDGQTVQDQLTGLLQTLPHTGFSMLVIESTANGYNYFKSLWDQAEAGENDYIPLFVPWFEMEEYRMPYKGEALSPEEKEIKTRFGLSYEQMMWRRYAIRNLCGNDINKFRQEYPSTPEEAFIMSGTPFFDVEKVRERLNVVEAPHYRGMFTEMGNFYESEEGYVKIWEKPVRDHVYTLSADTAGDGSDWFRAYVIDKASGRIVANYSAQTDEGLFVVQLYFLGYYYNMAMIAPETNFSTYPVMKLQEMGYPNLYVREQVDTYMKRTQRKFGFKTTSLTRPLILDNFAEIFKEQPEIITDAELLKEMLSFVKNDKGRPEAAPGSHDDCVMAAAIGYYVMPQSRQTLFTEVEEEESTDYMDFINYGGAEWS